MPLSATFRHISSLVDDRNRELWKTLLGKYDISIEPSPNREHSCFIQADQATIYIPDNDADVSAFTHELLHLYLHYKEIYIGANFQLTISSSKMMSRIFVPGLIGHVGNCLEHMKMLPVYRSMNFDERNFLLDYDTHKCTAEELMAIKKYYKSGSHYNCAAVETFIGKFFAMVADANTNFNYSFELTELKKIDGGLYQLLLEFTSDWEKYDIESIESLTSYRDIVQKFYEGLKKWITNKTFTNG